jgi:hypothetical protein
MSGFVTAGLLFVRAYPRETKEMVFDAHDRAFAEKANPDRLCGGGVNLLKWSQSAD